MKLEKGNRPSVKLPLETAGPLVVREFGCGTYSLGLAITEGI